MYAWIWRKLPGGLTGKLLSSLVLIAGISALLWFYAFPLLAPVLPFNQVTIPEEQQEENAPGEDPGRVPSYDPSDYELEESPSESGGTGD